MFNNLFHWSNVDLQCCVNFYCTGKWFSNTYTYIYSSHILFHYGLSQDIEYSSLCYTEGPSCLSLFLMPFLFYFISIFLWLHWVFVAAHRLSLVAWAGATLGCSARASLSVALLLLWSTGSRTWASVVAVCELRSCGSRPLELGLSSCGAQSIVAAAQHVESSQHRVGTHVPYVGWWIPVHSATRQV